MYEILTALPVISKAFLISSVSSIPVTLMPVNGSFPYANHGKLQSKFKATQQDIPKRTS